MLRRKFRYLENEKSFNIEQKAFFIIFKRLSLNQTKQFLLEDESPTLKCRCVCWPPSRKI